MRMWSPTSRFGGKSVTLILTLSIDTCYKGVVFMVVQE